MGIELIDGDFILIVDYFEFILCWIVVFVFV